MTGILRARRVQSETPLGVRVLIARRLLQSSKDGCIPKGTVPSIAKEFGVSKSTIYRINRKAVKSLSEGCLDVSSQRKKCCGSKAKHDTMALQEALEGIPFLHARLYAMQHVRLEYRYHRFITN